jgi:phosphoglycerate kinase
MSGFDFGSIRSIEGVDVAGRRVLVRADLNVPLRDGEVADATRIERILPTVRLLQQGGAKVIVLSHLGRPKGGRSPETSLAPVAARMQAMMPGSRVAFLADCVGAEVARGLASLRPGDVALLENLRYHAGEKNNDPAFAAELAAFADLYVNDAFSSAHRAHASTDAIASLLPSYAGLLMIAEIRALERALEHPKRPVMAIVGGAKVSTKIAVLNNLVHKVDQVVVAGGMANTFLFAHGLTIGNSLCEKDAVPTVKQIEARAAAAGCEIVLPRDAVVAKSLAPHVETKTCSISAVPRDSMILDIGSATVEDLKFRLGEVRTLLWNGPLGAFETPPFEAGTFAVAREAGRLTELGRLVSIGGGGDTVAALNAASVAAAFTYVSTAGGAFLEWLEGKDLPAVAALARGPGATEEESTATEAQA